MRKRYYIMFVARGSDGELLKIPIPIHYLYVFVAGAVIGMMSITGMIGSYTRMLAKTLRFNELRQEKEALKKNYNQLEKVAQAKEAQVASLSSLAGEVSALYGLRSDSVLVEPSPLDSGEQRNAHTLEQLYGLKSSAMAGVATMAVGFGKRNATLEDWTRLASAPTLWPVQGRVMSSFAERQDPFSGEGAFHRGVDISAGYGQPVVAPADGIVDFADFRNGYGRTVAIDHSYGITTLYGHLSGMAVAPGQHVSRGDVIGYVGMSGRSTGPHLHYEVHLNGVPVNPYKFLRMTAPAGYGLGHAD